MSKKINLDALIPREDFEVHDSDTVPTNIAQNLKATDLAEDSFFFSSIRKPDFQRETNEWDQERVISLIQSFLDDELIPAVILWKNQAGFTFVIDGAHRLSALAAWVNNDYGDGSITKSFYESIISEEQIEIASRLRERINKTIGPYSDYKLAIKSPEKVKEEIAIKARLLGSLAIQIQWVNGDAKKAEASFFKINQKAAPIDKTEFILLESRNKPNGIATRAILRSGKGHKYWSSFAKEQQQIVQDLALDINDILFKPSLKTPLKTLDIPVAGKSFSSQTQMLVLEFVNIVNNIQVSTKIPDDVNGSETIKALKKCLTIAQLINSNHASSLGLHPAVYFYARNGRYKPASFNFFLQLFIKLRDTKKLNEFTKVRAKFEDIVLNYDDLPRQIIRKYRTSSKGAPYVVEFYLQAIKLLNNDLDVKDVIERIFLLPDFNYLTMKSDDISGHDEIDFDSDGKSEVFMNEALKNSIKCKICGGYLHRNAISIDHITRKQDGGSSNVENGQVSHPYCNTGYKN
ncbi:hypothetical protein UNDYM_4492 [Undibacterium sp. YM2]|uniref:HNH endonuclease family protein n=1 Tax=Undibacterium sp. YM2 TaxID=2058625 RepID=UPI001331ECF7|nr:DUF262 domain-containing protein [Undibacterium sp. YM2]BBB68745.1 hypothetical protein UNDYM_4492 [Undibacterium sp. YM2]